MCLVSWNKSCNSRFFSEMVHKLLSSPPTFSTTFLAFHFFLSLVTCCANFQGLLLPRPFFLMLHEAAVASRQANRSFIRSFLIICSASKTQRMALPCSRALVPGHNNRLRLPRGISHHHLAIYPRLWKSSLFMDPDKLQLYVCGPGGFVQAAQLLAVSHRRVLKALQRTALLGKIFPLF